MGIKLPIKPNTSYELVVEPHEADMPLDVFLVSRFPGLSRNFFQRLVESNCVHINKHPVAKQGVKIRPGDLVNVTIPLQKRDDLQTRASSVSLEVIYEHEHFLIIIIISQPGLMSILRDHSMKNRPLLIGYLSSTPRLLK